MSTTETEPDQGAGVGRPSQGALVRRDLVCGLAMLAVVALFLGAAGAGLGRDWLFPKVLSYVLAVIALLLVGRGLLRLGGQMPLVPVILRGQGVDILLFVVMAVAYVVLIPSVGFWLMTLLMVFGASVYLDTSRSLRGMAVSAGVAIAVCVAGYLVLTDVFYIGLPAGLLF